MLSYQAWKHFQDYQKADLLFGIEEESSYLKIMPAHYSYFDYDQYALNYWYLSRLDFSVHKKEWIFKLFLERMENNLDSFWLNNMLLPASGLSSDNVVHNCEVCI